MHSRLLLGIIFILIIFLGAYLRLINLGSNPNGFYVDEAAIGYNSFSFLETGKDEYGMAFPIFLRSFGTYASSLYAHVSVIFIWLFGLNITSVRLLSAISGIISIILIYFIVKKQFRDNSLSLVSAFIFAISPWSIFFSRGAYEANLALMFLFLAILLMLKSVEKIIYLPFGLFVLSISTYAYQAERLIAYILIAGFLGIYFKKIIMQKNSKLILSLSLFIFFIIQIPQLLLINTPAFRLRQAGLFYLGSINAQSQELSYFIPVFIGWPLAFIRDFFAQVMSYLSPRNLFFEGDPDLQRSFPQLSVFYSWMVIPYFVGWFEILKKSKDIKLWFGLMLVSFLLAPALTKDPFSTLRAMPLILPLIIILSLGIKKIISIKNKYILGPLFMIILIASVLSLYRSAAVLLPNERASTWGFGFSQLADEIKKRPTENFLIDNGRIKPAYIELAFFLHYPPEQFQLSVDQSVRNNYYNDINWDEHYKFGNIETRQISWQDDVYESKILVGDELAISAEQQQEHFLEEVFEIKNPVDEIIFKAYRTNPERKCLKQFREDKCIKN